MSFISNKCYYALKATFELSKSEGRGPLTIGQIAKRQTIPARFLESILRQLKQSGLVDSLRGKDGGYFLQKSAKEILVGEVIQIFTSSLLSENINKTPGGVVDDLSTEAENALFAVFNSVSFSELVKREEKK